MLSQQRWRPSWNFSFFWTWGSPLEFGSVGRARSYQATPPSPPSPVSSFLPVPTDPAPSNTIRGLMCSSGHSSLSSVSLPSNCHSLGQTSVLVACTPATQGRSLGRWTQGQNLWGSYLGWGPLENGLGGGRSWFSDWEGQHYPGACWNCRISVLPEHLTSPTPWNSIRTTVWVFDWGLEPGAEFLGSKFKNHTAFGCYFSLRNDPDMGPSHIFLDSYLPTREKSYVWNQTRKDLEKGTGGLCCSSIQLLTNTVFQISLLAFSPYHWTSAT